MPPNNHPLRVTILGSGTCVPSLERSACSVLITFDDTVFLLDCGPGTMRRLLEAGISIFDVTHLGVSHFHPDHTGELVPFLFANKYPDGSRRKKPLSLIGGPGFKSFFNQLSAVYGDWIDMAGKRHLIEMAPAATQQKLPGFLLQTAPMAHRPESIAFRINAANGKSIVYSGDTDESENLVALSAGADVLICESALPDELKVDGHLTPSLAGQIANRAGVKKLVLTHFYPECEAADIETQCRSTYAGPLELARDLLCLTPEGAA
ncbi:MAG TPA: MBL fold metallo-hydrolase [Desulfosalsimonadaceae bacterium]|nr:MBL fold metallo-hydrolase [Desulfosalsimonadaceae bacterium]